MSTRLPFHRQISVKLTIAYLTVALVILTAMALLSMQFSQNGYERLIQQQFQSTLKVNEDFIEQVSLATETWAQHLASEPEIKGYFLSHSPELMPIYIRQYESAGLLQFRTLLLNPDGKLLYDLKGVTPAGTSFGTTEIVINALRTGKPGSAILHDGNHFTLYSAAPTLLDGNIVGLVLIGKVLDQAFINQVSQATGVDITIVRERAIMASTLMKGDEMGDLPIPYLEYQALLNHPGDSVVRTLFGETYFISAKPLQKMDGQLSGSIFLAKSHAEMDEVREDILKRILTISVLGILAIIVLGLFIYRYLNGIRQLTQATIKVSESGEFQLVTVKSNDEIGILAKNFNRMLQSVNRKSHQLKEYSDTLEDKVNKRTLELQMTLGELNKFSLAVDQSPVAVVITDLEGNIEYINPRFAKATGYSSNEILGKNSRILKSGRTSAEDYVDLWQTITAGKVWRGEFYNRCKDGSMYWERTAITPIKSENGQVTHYLGMKEDVTASKEYEQTLLKQATFDSLTDLPNRILARDRLQQTLASAARNETKGALLFIDLDNFKRINDTLGHNVGDKLLIEAGQRISSCIRKEDTTARLSGDEFLVIIGDLANEYHAETVARHIIDTLCQPLTLAEQNIVITASIGIALFPTDSTDINELMRYADTAMYRAKAMGRNGYCFFTEEMNTEVTSRLKMENELRNALKNEELELHFQPLINLNSGRTYAAEALLRWNSCTLGAVSPAQFIPLAEESDLIHQLGDWVLNSACQQAAQWRKHGYLDIQVAVNISPIQFRQFNLVQTITDTLTVTGLPASNLEIEITEGALLEDTDKALTTLNELRNLGVSLSIDDFGTGYSSLSYLSQFPFDVLKIDKSFIDRVIESKHCRALTTGIIDLAHNLDMHVVGEGVEKQEQLEFLQVHGCDRAQGYLYSKPVPYSEFIKYLANNPTN